MAGLRDALRRHEGLLSLAKRRLSVAPTKPLQSILYDKI